MDFKRSFICESVHEFDPQLKNNLSIECKQYIDTGNSPSPSTIIKHYSLFAFEIQAINTQNNANSTLYVWRSQTYTYTHTYWV